MENLKISPSEIGVVCSTDEQTSTMEKQCKSVKVVGLADIAKMEKQVIIVSCVKHNRK